jgi:hypothetical protein
MGRGRKKRKKGNHTLAGTQQQQQAMTYGDTAKQGGLILLTAIAAGGVGAVFGKHSLIAGIPVTLFGIYKKNNYIVAAGLGLTMSNGFQKKAEAHPPAETVEGFDIKVIASEAKDRVGNFFKNFGEKLYLPKPKEEEATAGLGEDEEVTYFVNPYSNKELDMSAIDRVQEQIAEMNKGANTNGLSEIEREF